MTAKEPLKDFTVYDVPLDDLVPFPGNPRVGAVEAISQSLKANGQFRPIVVRRETREILGGNHTWKAAKALGWNSIRVCYLENLTDDEATKIVLADNRYSDLAQYDDRLLAELLASLDGSWEGTGYGLGDVETLIEELTTPDAVPDFKPEPEEVNPVLDERARHECPHCAGAFEIVNGKPKAVG